MMYEVLETEKTLDFAEGLIGDAFTIVFRKAPCFSCGDIRKGLGF